ncbi:DNA methylase N-4 [Spirosoma sp. HMF4905]|uniref:DNA methylase N-4 n=1 Tax=Spirosoma arboris TaxID=2682092 RepID=A0A7K1SQJ1_9BACT|nr:DNA methyltransferase [Spirosoma arboris]MVM36059.1 DNA methylase N-4 [Spirosoma arboris]
MSNYQKFIESKVVAAPRSGFVVKPEDLHESLFPHQRDCTVWALYGGQRAIFAGFGLGKTRIQLEICRQEYLRSGKPCLIICPLGVRQEFVEFDGLALGMTVEYIKTEADAVLTTTPYHLTNYERIRDGNIDLSRYQCVCLDEASCLRSLGSKTYIEFNERFQSVPSRYVATATPSPNEFIELLNYASFLGIMDVGQAKTRFFQRNSEKADNLTLLPHKEEEFWLWVSTWALFVNKPSDLGYSDEGYDLPEMQIHWHLVDTSKEVEIVGRDGQLQIYKDSAIGLAPAAKEKSSSMQLRWNKAASIIENDPGHYLIWHHLEDERKLIEKNTDRANVKTVYGTQKDDLKEKLLIDFANGKYPILATKPEIAGQGCNFQRHCHQAIFLGINYKFNEFIQSIFRIVRFGQTKVCHIHIIYTDAEDHIRRTLLRKWKQHDRLLANMREIIGRYGLSGDATIAMRRAMGVDRIEVKGDRFTCVHNDTVLEHERLPDNYFDLGITSIPFSIQYEYSANYNDFGHNASNEAFFHQMGFLVPNMLRTLKPGRIYAVHVKDRVLPGNFSGLGMYSIYPFSHDTVRCFQQHGFVYCGEITIPTDVVKENNGTYRLGYSEMLIDGTKMSVGVPEKILLFRKLPSDQSNAYADEPVTKTPEAYSLAKWQIDAHSFWRSSGDRLLTPSEIATHDLQYAMKLLRAESAHTVYDFDRHVAIAEALGKAGNLPTDFMAVDPQSWHPDVWADVVRMRSLNTNQGQRREQKHLCPLPLDIVRRLIDRYSNPGDLVGDAFGGLMSVPYQALLMDRRGWGCELNYDYFKPGVKYCQQVERKQAIPTLFDTINNQEAA